MYEGITNTCHLTISAFSASDVLNSATLSSGACRSSSLKQQRDQSINVDHTTQRGAAFHARRILVRIAMPRKGFLARNYKNSHENHKHEHCSVWLTITNSRGLSSLSLPSSCSQHTSFSRLSCYHTKTVSRPLFTPARISSSTLTTPTLYPFTHARMSVLISESFSLSSCKMSPTLRS